MKRCFCSQHRQQQRIVWWKEFQTNIVLEVVYHIASQESLFPHHPTVDEQHLSCLISLICSLGHADLSTAIEFGRSICSTLSIQMHDQLFRCCFQLLWLCDSTPCQLVNGACFLAELPAREQFFAAWSICSIQTHRFQSSGHQHTEITMTHAFWLIKRCTRQLGNVLAPDGFMV